MLELFLYLFVYSLLLFLRQLIVHIYSHFISLLEILFPQARLVARPRAHSDAQIHLGLLCSSKTWFVLRFKMLGAVILVRVALGSQLVVEVALAHLVLVKILIQNLLTLDVLIDRLHLLWDSWLLSHH